MFREKNDVNELVHKAHKVKKYATELVECLEDTVQDMEEEYGTDYRYHDYYEPESYRRSTSRYEYGKRMR